MSYVGTVCEGSFGLQSIVITGEKDASILANLGLSMEMHSVHGKGALRAFANFS